MSDVVACWRCGAVLQNLILPLSRREECSACAADQHVCKMCEYFEANTIVQCTEERAEPPGDKEAANFCDYFSLNKAGATATHSAERARQQLDELFGGAVGSLAEHEPTDPDPGSANAFDAEAELRKLFDD